MRGKNSKDVLFDIKPCMDIRTDISRLIQGLWVEVELKKNQDLIVKDIEKYE